MRKKEPPKAQPANREALRHHTGIPFSRPFVVDRLRADVVTEVTVTADASELVELAEFDGLDRVDRLDGRFRLARHGASVHVTGEIEAEVVQTCVVSLEPFPVVVRETVDIRYAPESEVEDLEAALARMSGNDFEDVAEADDVPDPIVDGRIDLGALAAEFLVLGLDPHPRKPGATFAAETIGDQTDTANVSPFAALRARADKN